jgi:hypothetical protein
VNFYLVANVYIFVFFVFAILSDIEMDKRLHEKDNECDEGNYNKDDFHFYYI